MKIREFIEWLEKQDQESEVYVVIHTRAWPEYEGFAYEEAFSTDLAYGESSPHRGKNWEISTSETPKLLLGSYNN